MATKARKPSAPAPQANTPRQFNSLRAIPQALTPPPVFSSDELVEILDGIVQVVRASSPAQVMRTVQAFDGLAKTKPFTKHVSLGEYPRNGDPVASADWLQALLGKALAQTLAPECPEECFGAKNIAISAERAGIKLPQHLNSQRLGADAARRMQQLKGVRIVF